MKSLHTELETYAGHVLTAFDTGLPNEISRIAINEMARREGIYEIQFQNLKEAHAHKTEVCRVIVYHDDDFKIVKVERG